MLAELDDSVSGIRTPEIERICRDWDNRRRGRALPSRADFDLQDLRYALGNLSLIEVLRDPLRYVYRVHATEVARRVGYDLTGKTLDLMPLHGDRKNVTGLFNLVLEKRHPVVQTRDIKIVDSRIGRCEVAALPLASDGTTIDKLFSIVVWM